MTRRSIPILVALALLGGCAAGIPAGDPEAAARWQRSVQPECPI